MKLVVVGAGSIGSRHIRNLLALGVREIIACDPNPSEIVDSVGYREDWRGALPADAALICTSPGSHVRIATECALAGCHLFIEKPLSNSTMGVAALRKATEGLVVQMGFNLRFHSGLTALRRRIQSGELGSVLHLSIMGGSYLPDWRLGDYREGYSASADEGGVVLDCCSHAFDLAGWLLGKELVLMESRPGHSGLLDVGGEDIVDVVLRAGQTRVAVHENYLTRQSFFSVTATGTEAIGGWAYDGDEEMYRRELAAFLSAVEIGRTRGPTLEEGIVNLRLCLEAKG